METKICKKCGRELPINEFYKHKEMSTGYLNYCKDCVRKRVTKHRIDNIENVRAYDRNRPNARERGKKQREKIKNNLFDYQKMLEQKREWTKRNRDKRAAHRALYRAILAGKIIKSNCCSLCGKTECNIEGHHYDYSKPLNVIWVCTECHGKLHRKYNKLEIPF